MGLAASHIALTAALVWRARLEEWRKVIQELLDHAEAACLDARNRLQKAEISASDRLKYQRLLDDAEHNLRMVKLGHGEHNVTYATALLNITLDYTGQITKALAGAESGTE